ncbi:HNH endonuclease [Streptomyces sp. NPDC050507]|uniref:HNH endonuclease n=1 Tax=Streptomyces sp. NPDC050507 TaxID=3365619 RepID=UPI0037A28FFC
MCRACKALVPLGSTYCASCRPRRKWNALKAPASARGYDALWRRLRATAIAAQPWCSRCRTTGSLANPLTGDHIVPLARGGTNVLSNVQVLCRSCNSSKQDA